MTDPTRPRPYGIAVLVIMIACLAFWNSLRLGEAIFFWKTLSTYGAHPLYISLSAGFWLVMGIALVVGLWRRQAWARMAAFFFTGLYPAWYWFDRLVLQKPHANWPFVLTMNCLFVLIMLVILLSKRTQRFFKRDSYEQ